MGKREAALKEKARLDFIARLEEASADGWLSSSEAEQLELMMRSEAFMIAARHAYFYTKKIAVSLLGRRLDTNTGIIDVSIEQGRAAGIVLVFERFWDLIIATALKGDSPEGEDDATRE